MTRPLHAALRSLLLLGLLLQGIAGAWANACAHAATADTPNLHAAHAQHHAAAPADERANPPDRGCGCGCTCPHPCALGAAKVPPAAASLVGVRTQGATTLASSPVLRTAERHAIPPLRPPIRT